MRALFLIHRYLGIAVGVLLALWCLSGIVMIYVPFPQLHQQDRLRGLEPIQWSKILALSGPAFPSDEAVVDRFELEMLAGSPVLRLGLSDGASRLIDLQAAKDLAAIAEYQAIDVASRYAARHALSPGLPTVDLIDFDQWTVGGFYTDRPLYRVRLHDAKGTELYASSLTGKLIQATDQWHRFWGWIGAVPHWLYPSILRQHPRTWSWVVTYSSLLGIFLTVTGLVIGIRQWRWGGRVSAGRSPYAGILFLHHVPGLVFGVLTLTWVLSGMLSVNPWGLMEGRSFSADRGSITGAKPTYRQVRQCLERLGAQPLPPLQSLRSASLGGVLYAVGSLSDGSVQRFDAEGAPVLLGQHEIDAAASRVAGQHASWRLITEPDTYHYSVMEQHAVLPAIRVQSTSTEDAFYLDPVSGELVDVIDAASRQYRWWHSALHRYDFSPAFRSTGARTLLMLPLLLGAAFVSLTGAYLGLRRLLR